MGKALSKDGDDSRLVHASKRQVLVKTEQGFGLH